MLKHASVIISIITATLYTLGLTFHQGYLREFGITDSMFPLSVDQILFQGFVSFSTMGATAIIWFFVAAEGVLLTALIGSYILKKAQQKNWLRAQVISSSEKLVQENVSNEADNSFVAFSSKMFVYATLVFVVFIGILLVLMASDKSGREAAAKFKENVASGKTSPTKMYLKEKNKELVCYLVTSNQNQVACLIDKNVVIMNLSDISSMSVK